MRKIALGLAVHLCFAYSVLALDVSRVFELIREGPALSAEKAGQLEKRLEGRPRDQASRILLLSYYASQPEGLALEDVKAARLRHVLKLIEQDPKEGFGLFQVSTGIDRINCQGDPLADPEGARQVLQKWLEQVSAKPNEASFRRHAADVSQYCDPEVAEKLRTDLGDVAGLGRLYGSAVLGITGLSYTGSDPVGSDPQLRQTPFALKALGTLENATDRDLVTEAARTVLGQGAILWAEDKLDWDYTPLGNYLLAKARKLSPENMRLKTLPTDLPARGERPPRTITVGGRVQRSRLVRDVAPKPVYRPGGRPVRGTVQLAVLIGLDGRVLDLQVQSGPPELASSAVEVVRQWEYKPSTTGGRACYVITRIDVNYR